MADRNRADDLGSDDEPMDEDERVAIEGAMHRAAADFRQQQAARGPVQNRLPPVQQNRPPAVQTKILDKMKEQIQKKDGWWEDPIK